MERGDHIISPRTGFEHHGLYLGFQRVIHYTGSEGKHIDGTIVITSLAEFCQGQRCSVRTYRTRAYSREASIQRAHQRLGEQRYHAIFNNCEHFVTWCILGEHQSNQVDAITEVIGAGVGAGIGMTLPTASEAPVLIKTLTSLAPLASPSTGTTAGTAAGTAAQIAIGSSVSSSTGISCALASGIAAPTVIPVVTSLATGLAVGYGVKKLVEWIFDS